MKTPNFQENSGESQSLLCVCSEKERPECRKCDESPGSRKNQQSEKDGSTPHIFGTAGERMDFHADAVDDSLNGRIENFNQQKQEHRDDEKRFFWQGYRQKKCRGDEDHGQKELFTEGRFVLKTSADSFDRIACGVDEASQSSFAFQGLGGGCGLLRLGHIEVLKKRIIKTTKARLKIHSGSSARLSGVRHNIGSSRLEDVLTKRAVGVKRGDLFERNRLNLGALPLAAESQIAFAAEVFSSLAGGFEVSTRIKA